MYTSFWLLVAESSSRLWKWFLLGFWLQSNDTGSFGMTKTQNSPFVSLKSHQDCHGVIDACIRVDYQFLHHDVDLDFEWTLSVCKLFICICICICIWPWHHRRQYLCQWSTSSPSWSSTSPPNLQAVYLHIFWGGVNILIAMAQVRRDRQCLLGTPTSVFPSFTLAITLKRNIVSAVCWHAVVR